MKNFVKNLMLLSLLLTNFIAFVQSSDDDTGGGNLDGNDVPINNSIVFLIIAGIVLAYYSFKVHKKNKILGKYLFCQ
jgi:hypothetical protein